MWSQVQGPHGLHAQRATMSQHIYVYIEENQNNNKIIIITITFNIFFTTIRLSITNNFNNENIQKTRISYYVFIIVIMI